MLALVSASESYHEMVPFPVTGKDDTRDNKPRDELRQGFHFVDCEGYAVCHVCSPFPQC